MAENADMPPPRYQMDGTLPTMHSGVGGAGGLGGGGGGGVMVGSSAINPGKFLLSKASHVAVDDAEEHSNSCYYSVAYTRTLPHPKHQQMHHQIVPPRDDSMIGKNGYLPAPSPAPPMDGSYYNMNSDRYLSYPPMVSAPPVLSVCLSVCGCFRRNNNLINSRVVSSSSLHFPAALRTIR